ncbi:MAG: hypothetical protein GY795_19170 [Desulfobacterales bacterium]|nr:hypothetical protein [Desulfobacterales bacterium]
MKFWQKPAGFSAKISFRHSGSVNYLWNKMKDASSDSGIIKNALLPVKFIILK